MIFNSKMPLYSLHGEIQKSLYRSFWFLLFFTAKFHSLSSSVIFHEWVTAWFENYNSGFGNYNSGFGNYDLETMRSDLETGSSGFGNYDWFGNYEVRLGNCSNNTRHLSSIATYNVRSSRDVNMPPHPTPPHPTPSCTHRSNNTRDLCSIATHITYEVAGTLTHTIATTPEIPAA